MRNVIENVTATVYFTSSCHFRQQLARLIAGCDYSSNMMYRHLFLTCLVTILSCGSCEIVDAFQPKIVVQPTKDVTVSCSMRGFNDTVGEFSALQLCKSLTGSMCDMLMAEIQLYSRTTGDFLPLFNKHVRYGGDVYNGRHANQSHVWITFTDMWPDERVLGEYMCRAYYRHDKRDKDSKSWISLFTVTPDSERQSWSNSNMTTEYGLSVNCRMEEPRENVTLLNVTHGDTLDPLVWMEGDHANCSRKDAMCWLSVGKKVIQLHLHEFNTTWQENDTIQCNVGTLDRQYKHSAFPSTSAAPGNSTESYNCTTNTTSKSAEDPEDCLCETILSVVFGVLLCVGVLVHLYVCFKDKKKLNCCKFCPEERPSTAFFAVRSTPHD